MDLRKIAEEAIGDSDAEERREDALEAILDVLNGTEDAEAEDAAPASLEAHDRRFHGGRFDAETMTCKLRDELAKSDDADAVIARHETSMKGISNAKASEYLRLMAKKCPQLDPEDTLEKIAAIKDRKLQGDAFRWLMKGRVKLPEDMQKVEGARMLADKSKKDPFSYDSPQACINDLNGNFKVGVESLGGMIDPDTVPELTDKKVYPMGVTTYAVQDDRAGQVAMRKILNTHFGKDKDGNYISPWCLLYGDGHGGLSKESWKWWNHYDILPKRVAFKDGKLLAFMATDGGLDLQYDADGNVDFRESSDTGLDNVYEDEYSEYEEWLQTDEGQEEQASFLEWLAHNYPELLNRDVIRKYASKHANEEWWDRDDVSHSGIPLGNLPVKGDAFGRWADYEIRNGKAKKLCGFHKGIRHSGDFTLWYENGLVASREIGDRILEYNEDGTLDSYENVGASEDVRSCSFRYNGEIVSIAFTDEDGDSCDYKVVYTSGTPRIFVRGPLHAEMFMDGESIDGFDGVSNVSFEFDKNGNLTKAEKPYGVITKPKNDNKSYQKEMNDFAYKAREHLFSIIGKADSLKPAARRIYDKYRQTWFTPEDKANLKNYLNG